MLGQRWPLVERTLGTLCPHFPEWGEGQSILFSNFPPGTLFSIWPLTGGRCGGQKPVLPAPLSRGRVESKKAVELLSARGASRWDLSFSCGEPADSRWSWSDWKDFGERQLLIFSKVHLELNLILLGTCFLDSLGFSETFFPFFNKFIHSFLPFWNSV